MTEVSEVAENIYMIDSQLFSIPKWGSVYLINEEQKALIETGPATSANVVLDGIRQVGVKLEDIAYIIVTHIHLDHAGGAGALLGHMPQARLMVHHKGIRHLADPTKLVNSAIEARGNEITTMHGEVLPIEMHRMRAVNDGDTLRLSGQQALRFIDAPGHAPHELCIYETRNGGVFTGDAVAVYIRECNVLLPFHPPPHFDMGLCLGTLERLKKSSARRIYYSHFGVTDQVQEHLDRARKQLMVWDDILEKAAKEGAFADAKARLLDQAYGDVEPMKDVPSLAPLYDYLLKIHLPMCADGHIKYFREAMRQIGRDAEC